IIKASTIKWGAGSYPDWSGGTPVAYSNVIKVYLNPSDPSLPQSGNYQNIGFAGYAANAQVFGRVNSKGSLLGFSMDSQENGGPTLARSFPDSTSNTDHFTEKYARCNMDRTPALDWNGTWWDYGWCKD